MHCPPAEGNFCNEHRKPIKLPTVHGHNRYRGTGIDVTTRWTLIPLGVRPKNGPKKIFFHLLDPNILKSFIILTSCDSKWLHWLFRLTM